MAVGDVGRLVGGRYRVDRELERGAGTRSLLVTDLRNGRPCVLRELSVAAVAPAAARRFEVLAEILAKLDHPGLPRFVDGFTEGEGAAAVRAIVTSYHPGENLERLVAKGRPLTEAQALVLLRRIVPVLVYLHAFDPPLVHRTISATGIILGPDGRPCLTDIDYAVADQAAPTPEQATPGSDELALAAPEVFTSGAVPASDIYALGLAVCRGMTARDPATLLREGAKMLLRGALGVSEAFAAVLSRMLEVSLERRYADARALGADLARLAGVRVPAAQQPATQEAEEPPPRRGARPLIIAGVVLVFIALLATAAVLLRNRPEPATTMLLSPAPQEQIVAPSPEPAAPQAGEPVSPQAGELAPAVPETAVTAPLPGLAAAPESPAPEPAVPPAVAPPALAPAAPPDSSPASAEGRLLIDGKLFANAAAPAPLFWFRDEGKKIEVKPRVDHAAGVFRVHGLSPGSYAMSVRINLEPGDPNFFPGDLTAWQEFTIEPDRPTAVDVSLRTVMHLVQPVDNRRFIPGWEVPCGAGNRSPGKLVFSWDALDPGTRYSVSVDRLVCGRGYVSAGRVFARSTTEAWTQVDLPPNQEGECYSFRLSATREGRTVGIMTTHGTSGLGWDYRFTVAGR